MDKFGIVYNGLPLKPSVNGMALNWINLFKYIRARRNGFLEFDGWKFKLDYGILYIVEKKDWTYYIPPTGLKNKRILSVGGGCGEDAKFFLDNGAESVHVIENNINCGVYLFYNNKYVNSKMTYELRAFKIDKDYPVFTCYHINKYYDLLKMDTEGYEMDLIPYLDYLDLDIVLESHCNYITDKLIEKGFRLIKEYKRNREIHGGVVQLCRWK